MADDLTKKPKRKNPVYSVYLNDTIDEIVEEISAKEKRTPSNFIRNLIENFLKDYGDH